MGGCETAVDRGQELARLAGPTLLIPQPGEPGGAAELHGQDPLPARPVERLQEELLGRGGGIRAARQQDQVGLDAHELRDAPVLLVSLGSRERLVDRREGLGDLPDSGQALRQRAEQTGLVRHKAGLAQLVERGAQHLEPVRHLAAPDEQDPVQAAAARVPGRQPVPGGVVE